MGGQGPSMGPVFIFLWDRFTFACMYPLAGIRPQYAEAARPIGFTLSDGTEVTAAVALLLGWGVGLETDIAADMLLDWLQHISSVGKARLSDLEGIAKASGARLVVSTPDGCRYPNVYLVAPYAPTKGHFVLLTDPLD